MTRKKNGVSRSELLQPARPLCSFLVFPYSFHCLVFKIKTSLHECDSNDMSVLSLNITGSDRVTLTNASLPAQYKSEVNTCKDTERDIKKTLKASISFFL